MRRCRVTAKKTDRKQWQKAQGGGVRAARGEEQVERSLESIEQRWQETAVPHRNLQRLKGKMLIWLSG